MSSVSKMRNNNKSLNKLEAPQNHGNALSDPNRGPNSFRTRSPGVVLPLSASLGRTNTMVPFPDLNLMPDSQPRATSPTAGRSLSQKLDVNTQKPSENISVDGVLSDSDHTHHPPPLPSSYSDIYAEYNSLHEPVSSALAEGNGELSNMDMNSLAIVAVPDQETGESPVVQMPPAFGNNLLVSLSPPPPPKYKRPKELTKITQLGREYQKHYRDIFKRTRMIYDSLRLHLITEEMRNPEVGPHKPRSSVKASNMMRERGLWLNQEKHFVGSVPGVEIGDIFFHRLDLCMVGLHGQLQSGIDYLTTQRSSNGQPIATSIIVSGGYEDDEDRGDVLIYSGHGGQDKLHRQCQHQKLEGGNLAMECSMHYGFEIRVIRGFYYGNAISSKVYVYDGLYKIVEYMLDIGKSGFEVFKFKLVRMPGQPEMGSARIKLARRLRSRPSDVRPGYIYLDLSKKKENVPVYMYNDIDFDQSPRNYEYIAKSAISSVISAHGGTNVGCDCNYSCTDDCICVRKNGGELPYDANGNLLRGKPVIFECGTFCKCGPGCVNRVAQKGLKNRMEVFLSNETFWGLRTLDLIQAGAFICEYAGVVLTKEQAEMMNGDALVYPGRFAEKWRLWGNLSDVYPNYVQPNYPTLSPIDFAIDVSKMRNVASYISHSKEPNVMAQFVLHDHNNLMFPRVMLFALENISPLTQLSLDYVSADEVDERLAICN